MFTVFVTIIEVRKNTQDRMNSKYKLTVIA